MNCLICGAPEGHCRELDYGYPLHGFQGATERAPTGLDAFWGWCIILFVVGCYVFGA